tara:strand:- start:853 stop:1578 length:726 start_codon:yes stop_codon:yes gene_type:complete
MTFSLIPAIDIIDGKLVRLFKGDYDQQTVYQKTPYEMALHYQSMGFKFIHVVDLNGAKDGDLTNLPVIKQLGQIPGLKIQVGGGVRTQLHIQSLLDVGVSAVIIGSLFVQNHSLAIQLMHQFPDQIIAGLDIQNGYMATHGWTKSSTLSIQDALTQLVDVPLHSIITTDISKDGTFEGLNLRLYELMSGLTPHSIVASGGVASIDDLIKLRDMALPNVTACIVGKAIIEGKISEQDVTDFL